MTEEDVKFWFPDAPQETVDRVMATASRLAYERIRELIDNGTRLEERARAAETRCRGLESAVDALTVKLGEMTEELTALKENRPTCRDIDPDECDGYRECVGCPAAPSRTQKSGTPTFKVGDRVVMVEPDSARSGVGTVRDVAAATPPNSFLRYTVEWDGVRYACRESELRLVMAAAKDCMNCGGRSDGVCANPNSKFHEVKCYHGQVCNDWFEESSEAEESSDCTSCPCDSRCGDAKPLSKSCPYCGNVNGEMCEYCLGVSRGR